MSKKTENFLPLRVKSDAGCVPELSREQKKKLKSKLKTSKIIWRQICHFFLLTSSRREWRWGTKCRPKEFASATHRVVLAPWRFDPHESGRAPNRCNCRNNNHHRNTTRLNSPAFSYILKGKNEIRQGLARATLPFLPKSGSQITKDKYSKLKIKTEN